MSNIRQVSTRAVSYLVLDGYIASYVLAQVYLDDDVLHITYVYSTVLVTSITVLKLKVSFTVARVRCSKHAVA